MEWQAGFASAAMACQSGCLKTPRRALSMRSKRLALRSTDQHGKRASGLVKDVAGPSRGKTDMKCYLAGDGSPLVHCGGKAEPVLPPDRILRFLRMVVSRCDEYRGAKRVPLSAVAAMIGRSRLTLYRVLWTGRVSDDMATVLTPIVRQYEAGKLRFRRTSPHAADPNCWYGQD